MTVYYLHHSGFIIDTGKRAYVFDAYQDPAKRIQQMAEAGRELWFFVSHVHGDHYVPSLILPFANENTTYIVHEDVPLQRDLGATKARVVTMAVDEDCTVDDVPIHMYGSTDAGGSFHVIIDGRSIFHSGDLNWWHWTGESEEERAYAKEVAWRELGKLDGLALDLAMFPVDNRQGPAMEWGVIEFLRRVNRCDVLIPMHLNGPQWEPSLYVKALFPKVRIVQANHDGQELLSW